MLKNTIADAIRLKITSKLDKTEIDSKEVDALIEEVGELVVNLNKIFITEIEKARDSIIQLQCDIVQLGDLVDDLEEQLDDGGVVNNITISLDKNGGLRR